MDNLGKATKSTSKISSLCASVNLPTRASSKTWGRRKKKKEKRERIINPEDIQKGRVITDVREADDMFLALRERLALWPKGEEIIPLLMMLKSDQMCPSWVPCVALPPVTPGLAVENISELVESNMRASKV